MIHNQFWWRIILSLKYFTQQLEKSAEHLLISHNGKVFLPADAGSEKVITAIIFNDLIPESLRNKQVPVFRVNEQLTCELIGESATLSKPEIEFLQLYIPYAVIPYFSKKINKIYSISHLTQSVDGKIATCSGHSKWIGNQEDLIHTHCMRSICDAIIIGNNTLKADEPKLTVRNVEGPSPVKIVIGNTKSNLDSLLHNNEGIIISFSNKPLYNDKEGVKEIIIEEDYISSGAILNHLAAQGFCSVFIEGGAQTVSHFLKENNLDILQIHIANKILGSGKSAINLDTIETIDECVTLKNTKHYQLGEEILIVASI